MRLFLICVMNMLLLSALAGCGGDDDTSESGNAKSGLVKTGITESYVDYDDGYYERGQSISFERDNVLDVVTDSLYGFMWQDSDNIGDLTYTWSEAVAYCDGLNYAGYSDWRLPTIKEIETAIDYSQHSLNSVFENKSWTWTSSESIDDTAWVYTSYGNLYYQFIEMTGLSDSIYYKVSKFPVRCVRSGEDVEVTYVRNSDETVSSDESKLMWQDNYDSESENLLWEEAIDYCENLSLAGYSDWRLPNVRELKNILDTKNANMYSVFENSDMTNYWSATLQDPSLNIPNAVIVFFKPYVVLRPFDVTGVDNDGDGIYDEFSFDMGSISGLTTKFFSTYPINGDITVFNTITTGSESDIPSAKCVRDN